MNYTQYTARFYRIYQSGEVLFQLTVYKHTHRQTDRRTETGEWTIAHLYYLISTIRLSHGRHRDLNATLLRPMMNGSVANLLLNKQTQIENLSRLKDDDRLSNAHHWFNCDYWV